MNAADLHIEQVDTIQADKTSHPCQYDLRLLFFDILTTFFVLFINFTLFHRIHIFK